MKKGNLIISGMTAILLLTGCQSNVDNAEAEALKAQIENLEQQVAELKQQKAETENGESVKETGGEAVIRETEDGERSGGEASDKERAGGESEGGERSGGESAGGERAGSEAADGEWAGSGASGEKSAAADNNEQNQAGYATGSSTTYTMQELTDMVDAYVEKAKAASPKGNASEDMEQFFLLKKEEKRIDDSLDVHEDELEYLYRNNYLTRDEYRKLEQELETLEDKLDDVEDELEFMFGIDD